MESLKTILNGLRETFARKKDIEKLKIDGGIGYSEFKEISPRSYSHTIAESDFSEYGEGPVYISNYTGTVPPMFDMLAQDKKYILNVNGEESEKKYSIYYDSLVFGNMHLVYPDEPDTGEIYLIVFNPMDETFEHFIVGVASTVLSDFTFSISEKDFPTPQEVVHQINSKYGGNFMAKKILLEQEALV